MELKVVHNYWAILAGANGLLCPVLSITQRFRPVFTDILEKYSPYNKTDKHNMLCPLLCLSSPYNPKLNAKDSMEVSFSWLKSNLCFRKGNFTEVHKRYDSKKRFWFSTFQIMFSFWPFYFYDDVFPECLPFLIIFDFHNHMVC